MMIVKKQKGLAAVEATIILPLLLLLLLVIGEFGRLFYQYNTLSKALRASVRTVSVSDGENYLLDNALRDKVRNLILYGQETTGTSVVLPGLVADDVTFSAPFNMPSTSEDKYVTLIVSYDWSPMFTDNLNTFFGDSVSLSFPLNVSMTMRILNDG
ncbi:pilus assembly protein [Oceanimonas sp. CHS3-5]|uniref:TadE family protein n=1 Tax=Oceanimonas sp. CHS3-5 TaxID=3068186 RepID=UPI00273D5B09|nr:TadE family protein [Oceanimonas sp. CHS3-5]MDP5291068.1 pilus assembly protein [Oceanimonas sp. CHS3-5]